MAHQHMHGMITESMDLGTTASENTLGTTSIGAMGCSLNAQTTGFAIISDQWAINNAGELIGSLILLFIISLGIDLFGRYNYKSRFNNRYYNLFKATIRGFTGALLMLAIMRFNVLVILAIVFGTSTSHLIYSHERG